MKEAFKIHKFKAKALEIIVSANAIIKEYAAAGDDLTLRQLYYKFVSRNLFPDDRMYLYNKARRKWEKDDSDKATKNAEPNYKWLGDIVSNARLAGYTDWQYIKDRTRASHTVGHWDSPEEIIEYYSDWFKVDTREDQDYYIEVWVEKEALAGVLKKVCDKIDVRWFACKGYCSSSAMYEASKRFIRQEKAGKETMIIHLGDHDPSGIDMTRDIRDRLRMMGARMEVNRIALTIEQIREYDPPSDPARATDSRYIEYVENTGEDRQWELDALEPAMLRSLIEETVDGYTDFDLLEDKQAIQDEGERRLVLVHKNWDKIMKYLKA